MYEYIHIMLTDIVQKLLRNSLRPCKHNTLTNNNSLVCVHEALYTLHKTHVKVNDSNITSSNKGRQQQPTHIATYTRARGNGPVLTTTWPDSSRGNWRQAAAAAAATQESCKNPDRVECGLPTARLTEAGTSGLARPHWHCGCVRVCVRACVYVCLGVSIKTLHTILALRYWDSTRVRPLCK